MACAHVHMTVLSLNFHASYPSMLNVKIHLFCIPLLYKRAGENLAGVQSSKTIRWVIYAKLTRSLGPKVSQQNVALQPDDQFCSLHLSVYSAPISSY